MKRTITLSIILILTLSINAQNCNNFHRDIACRVEGLGGFKLFGQSKSATVFPSTTNNYQVALFGGYEYKVGLCTQRGFGPIHIRIINTEDQSVIYDNKDDKYLETFGFSNEKTKNVIFEITLMTSEKDPKADWGSGICLGIAIYWHKI